MNTTVSNEARAAEAPQRTARVPNPSQQAKAPARARSAVWLVAGLLMLSTLPLIFGVLRLIQLAGGAQIMPAQERFDASPLPVVVHIVSAPDLHLQARDVGRRGADLLRHLEG